MRIKLSIVILLFVNVNLIGQGKNEYDELDSRTRKLLVEKSWELSRMIEILNEDTNITSYERVVRNDTINGHITRGFGLSKQMRHIYFSSDSTSLFCGIEGTWVEKDSMSLEILIDIKKERDSNRTKPTFFGVLDIISISDEEVSLVKNVSRDGKWRRYFYLRRKEQTTHNKL